MLFLFHSIKLARYIYAFWLYGINPPPASLVLAAFSSVVSIGMVKSGLSALKILFISNILKHPNKELKHLFLPESLTVDSVFIVGPVVET